MDEDPYSPLVGPQREASNILSPLKVITGVIHCCSSLTTLQGTPTVTPKASAHSWSAQAIANVLSSLETQISWKLEADLGGTKFFRLGSIGRSIPPPKASGLGCWQPEGHYLSQHKVLGPPGHCILHILLLTTCSSSHMP